MMLFSLTPDQIKKASVTRITPKPKISPITGMRHVTEAFHKVCIIWPLEIK